MFQNKLLYRRQFILGNRFINEFDGWQKLKVSKNLYLTVHSDLEMESCKKGSKSLTLLGYIIDPANPSYDNKEIITRIINKSNSFNDIMSLVYPYSGRWVLIYNDGLETKILHDPCGTRQVYYTFKENNMWCASQPSLLSEVFNNQRSTNQDLLEYINSETFFKNERQFYGDGTIYADIKQLLPNHYLDINSGQVNRYWVDFEKENDLDYIVRLSAELLQGSLKAIINRYNVMMPVTSGWDSRLLLASSKDFKNDIHYYVSNMNILSPKHRDIDIPLKLSKKLNFNFKVVNDLKPLSKEISMLIEKNVTLGRNYLPKSLTIQYHLENNQNKVNIGGNASGIVKLVYGSNHPKDIDGEYLAKLMGLSSYPFIVRTLNDWVKEIEPEVLESGLNIPDLFYWEQRMGNWGAMYQAEQDIAVEEFLPFNNRKLLMLLAKADEEYRSAPDYLLYEKIISDFWPEVLSEPFNPETLDERMKNTIKRIVPINLKGLLKG